MRICSLTDIGRQREMNQDYLYTSEEAVGILPNLFIVADGMGGHNAGEFASRSAVERVVRAVLRSRKKDAAAVLTEAIEDANAFIKNYADHHAQMQGMGTTLVAACITEGRLLAANIGDSRLYLISDKIHQITKDHSLVQEMVRMGEIDEKDARHHPDKNIITRAVGVSDQIKIDFFEVELSPGNYILLCSDGLTNMVEDSALQTILTNTEDSLTEKAEKLVETANANGGQDNITVIVIQIDPDEVIK